MCGQEPLSHSPPALVGSKAHSLGTTWKRGEREGTGSGHWRPGGHQERNIEFIKPGLRVASSSSRPLLRKGEGIPLARPRARHHALPVLLGLEAGRRDSLLTITRSPGTTTDRECLQNCSCVRHLILFHQPLHHVSPMSYSFPHWPHPFLPQCTHIPGAPAGIASPGAAVPLGAHPEPEPHPPCGAFPGPGTTPPNLSSEPPQWGGTALHRRSLRWKGQWLPA